MPKVIFVTTPCLKILFKLWLCSKVISNRNMSRAVVFKSLLD